jgi:hypothetical protein
MSLDVYLKIDVDTGNEPYEAELFWANITHNMGPMAEEAGIYKALWRPEEIGCEFASDIIELLDNGLDRLKKNRNHMEKFNPKNNWGSWEALVNFTEEYLQACKEYPNAKIYVSR